VSYFTTRLHSFLSDVRGVTALEYGLIAAVVVAVGLAGFSIVGDEVAAKMNLVTNAVSDQAPGDSSP
jgi:Flp pilus assembly pilin Flp